MTTADGVAIVTTVDGVAKVPTQVLTGAEVETASEEKMVVVTTMVVAVVIGEEMPQWVETE